MKKISECEPMALATGSVSIICIARLPEASAYGSQEKEVSSGQSATPSESLLHSTTNVHCQASRWARRLAFCWLAIIASSAENLAQEATSDRQTLWIRQVNSRPTNQSKTKSSSDAKKAEQQKSFWKQELQEKLKSDGKDWTDADATWIYQRLCQLVVQGDATELIAKKFAPSILFPLKFDHLSRTTQRHPVVGWAPGSYTITQSPHFILSTQGSTKQAAEVAKLCEQTYAIWKQVFFTCWSNSMELQQALATGQSLPEPNDARFQIVLFRNRETYIKQLQQLEPNVAVSTGYFSPNLKTVFCYWDEATSTPTLRHELTHQFFSQALRGASPTLEELPSDFWIVEGVALYMESIQIEHAENADIARLGGWDAPRLQPARYRRLHDETWIPWDDFRRANNERFRTGADIQQWYSQAAGLTHFWMDGNSESRQAFLNYVMSVYQGIPKLDSLPEARDDAALRQSYDRFLMMPEAVASDFNPSPTVKEIVLSRCPITSSQLLEWPESSRTLDWLDASFSKIDDTLFTAPISNSKKPWDVRRLNVESTSITDASLPIIAKMPRLEELDLSRCGITDSGLEVLRGNKTLKTLWLTGNPAITDHGLEVLGSLPRLELTDLTATSITEEGWKQLLSKSPRLRRKKTQ
ncbi:MAG: DUF1570 domain-containing protein [Pirellulaceae bacterium]|nr:DUF1570 domain-containing protein [Pirellulaceae bacterium]